MPDPAHPQAILQREELLRALLEGMHQEFDEEELREAARSPGLDASLRRIGLTGRSLRGDHRVALDTARPDLPLVTQIVDGSVVIVERAAGRKVRVLRPSGHIRREWVDAAALFGTEERSWVRILPLLPAHPLSRHNGKTTPLRRVLALLDVERQDVGVVVIFAIAIGLLSLATPLAIQLLINWLAFGVLLQPIVMLGLGLVLCLTAVAGMRAAQRHAVEIIQRRLFVRAVTDLAARLSRVQVKSFDKASGPELANRFFDVLTLQKAASALLLDGLAAALQAAVGLLLLAFYHPFLLAFDFFVVVLVAIVLLPMARNAEQTAIQESKKKYAMAAWLEELARHPLVFKLGGTHLATERTDLLAHGYLGARTDHFKVFFRQYVGMQLVGVLVPTTLLVVCGMLVLDGQLTLGQLVAAEFIIASALAGLTKFTDKLETVYDLLAGVDKLGALFDLPLDRIGGAPVEGGAPAIALEDVTFSYPGSPATIGPVTLQVPARARLVIRGAPGTGKSTLAELILGARRPTSGTVSRNGVPLERLSTEDLHTTSMLLRSGALIIGKLHDNLTLGRAVPEETLWSTLERVGLAAKVRSLPEGLDTALTIDARPLSELEARALLVARALLLKPSLLVIDGLFDGVEREQRKRWNALLTDSDAPWTLIVLTAQPSEGLTGRTLTLREGGIDHGRTRPAA